MLSLQERITSRHTKNNLRRKCIRFFTLLDCLRITPTTAILSDVNRISNWPCLIPRFPELVQWGTLLSLQFAGGKRYSIHLDANHIDRSTTANPNKPDASVNKRVTSDDTHFSGKRTDFPLKFSRKCNHIAKSALISLLKRIR